MSKWTKEENVEGGRERAPIEVTSTTMKATGTLPMATGVLHASVHSVYECKVVKGRVKVGEVGGSLL